MRSILELLAFRAARIRTSPRRLRLRLGISHRAQAASPERPLHPPVPPRSIVVARMDRMGDCILFTAFMEALRHGFPDARISLVTSPVGQEVFADSTSLDRLLVFQEVPVFAPLQPSNHRCHTRLFQAASAFARSQIRPLRPDLFLAPRFDLDGWGTAYLSLFSNPRRSLAFAEDVTRLRRVRNKGENNLYTHVIHASGARHEVERHIEFLRSLGLAARPMRPSITVGTPDREAAGRLLAGFGPDRPLAAIGPGASHPRRRWPADRFAAIASRLARSGFRIVLLGDASERDLCRSVQSQATHPEVREAAGQLRIREACAVLQACRIFIGNDSGLAHLAAAAGIPVLTVSCHPATGEANWSESPVRFRPWAAAARTLQPPAPTPPCTDSCAGGDPHCILEISTDAVWQGIRELLPDMPVPSSTHGPS